jgi:hypothetical protein
MNMSQRISRRLVHLPAPVTFNLSQVAYLELKTGGLPQVAASRYDSTISLPGAGDGISKFTMNR